MTVTLPTPPPRIARLPRNKVGYPVPWFVAWIDGQPDFRVVGIGKLDDAVRFRQCWLCGQALGANAAFVIGPMCAVNRVSAEPPSHRDCAIYAATACPFLTNPGMRRRGNNLPDEAADPDGIMIDRNPGVALVWISRTWRVRTDYRLFDVGDPTETRWYAEGREATRSEVLASITSGLPLLRAEAEKDRRPAAALAELDRQYTRALALVPGGAR
ncbi:hypothetical protein ACFWOX_33905 [Streptomyces sp. NPDC058467]|uniref:hypothetical protein n=1 Tax=Streptomyces sp. NPDC058467 TaxID=3346513 RepID=UPI00364B7461